MTDQIKLKCLSCSIEYYRPPSIAYRSKKTYCSKECLNIYRKNNIFGKINAICKTCNNQFKFNRAELKKCKGAGSFCSREGQANGHLFIKCEVCHQEFKTYKSKIAVGDVRFCSKKCYNNRTNVIEKFFKSISTEDHPNGCWIWEGRKDKDGYGIIYLDKNIKAHRYTLELHGIKIPDDMLACHHCDTPSCVNPSHIFIGTYQDNARDRDNKGRGYLHLKHKIV